MRYVVKTLFRKSDFDGASVELWHGGSVEDALLGRASAELEALRDAWSRTVSQGGAPIDSDPHLV
jgi:hypothetical protein